MLWYSLELVDVKLILGIKMESENGTRSKQQIVAEELGKEYI
jgi:hypothetical protein